MRSFSNRFSFFFWSFLFYICLFVDDSKTQNFRSLYHEHTNSNLINVSKCNWFIQTKKIQKKYFVRKHELKIKHNFKQKTKKSLKQKEKIRITTKRIKKYTCKRCKHSIKFDNNIKFHEHIRIRHAKKSKSQSIVSFFTSFDSIMFLFFVSSKLIIQSLITFFSKLSFISSIATLKKSIFWTKIVSRSIVASKFSRFSIATFKSIYKFSKNANIVYSFISFRIFILSKFYLIMNDFYRMFVKKSNSFNLQRYQMRSFFSKNFDKCNRDNNFKNKYKFIQNRIMLWQRFHLFSNRLNSKYFVRSRVWLEGKQITKREYLI